MVDSIKGDSYNEEEDFASMLEEHEKRGSGRIISGEIVRIDTEEGIVLIDVGGKSEGKIKIEEIYDANNKPRFKVGDCIDVIVTNEHSERPSISHKKALKHYKMEERIQALGDNFKNIVVEAKIIQKNRGGYTLEDAEGIEYFMPKKESAIKDDSKVNGRRMKVSIINVKPEDDTIVVSRKRFFDVDNKNKRENAERLLNAAEPFTGVIKKITAFGMFVEVEGIEGLVHYTEISYKGPINPSKSFKEGEEVMVKAIGYDKDKKRLSFSIKATAEDPWKEIEKELEVGDAISVIVSNVESYGVFVDLGNDIEGFLHISEISWDKNIKHPNEHLKKGQEIVVEVIEINTTERRLRVSLKKLLERPFDHFCKTHKEGDIIIGTIATLTEFGAFVKIGTIDGLLHNEDAFWEKNMRCKDSMKEGDTVQVKIIRIDKEKERISLSRRSLLASPASDFSKTHQVDDKVKGTIRDIKDFGVFINIEEGVDALIKTEDLAPINKDDLKIGDEVEGVISVIDKENNRIRVSVKRLERKKERESMKAFNSDEKMTLGDIIKNKI